MDSTAKAGSLPQLHYDQSERTLRWSGADPGVLLQPLALWDRR